MGTETNKELTIKKGQPIPDIIANYSGSNQGPVEIIRVGVKVIENSKRVYTVTRNGTNLFYNHTKVFLGKFRARIKDLQRELGVTIHIEKNRQNKQIEQLNDKNDIIRDKVGVKILKRIKTEMQADYVANQNGHKFMGTNYNRAKTMYKSDHLHNRQETLRRLIEEEQLTTKDENNVPTKHIIFRLLLLRMQALTKTTFENKSMRLIVSQRLTMKTVIDVPKKNASKVRGNLVDSDFFQSCSRDELGILSITEDALWEVQRKNILRNGTKAVMDAKDLNLNIQCKAATTTVFPNIDCFVKTMDRL